MSNLRSSYVTHRMESLCTILTLKVVQTHARVASFSAVYGSQRSIHQLEPLKAAVARIAPSGEKSQEDRRYTVLWAPPVRFLMNVYERRLHRHTI